MPAQEIVQHTTDFLASGEIHVEAAGAGVARFCLSGLLHVSRRRCFDGTAASVAGASGEVITATGVKAVTAIPPGAGTQRQVFSVS